MYETSSLVPYERPLPCWAEATGSGRSQESLGTYSRREVSGNDEHRGCFCAVGGQDHFEKSLWLVGDKEIEMLEVFLRAKNGACVCTILSLHQLNKNWVETEERKDI